MQEQEQITVTHRQNSYLRLLDKKPRTTKDLTQEFRVSMPSAGKMITKLKKRNLVESVRKQESRGNTYTHRMIKPYSELNLIIRNIKNNSTGKQITEEEILYAAILRNGGMTGQQLTEQFIKVFPDRSKNSVANNVVCKAKRDGLCR